MRHLRNLIYLTLGLLLGLNSVLAFAESIPATTQPGYWKNTVTNLQGINQSAVVCKGVGEALYNGSSQYTPNPAGSSCSDCSRVGYGISIASQQCAVYFPAAPACPAGQNWTLSGSTCSRPDCVSPQVRNATTGLCEAPCPAAGSNAMIGGAAAWKIGGGSAACTVGFGYSGCKISCSSGVSAGGVASCTGCKFTGANTASGDTAGTPVPTEQKKDPTTPEGCLASGKSYITSSSGTTTCIALTDSPNPVKTTDTTKTTNEGGTTTKKQETTCDGGNCTETTEETAPDGTKKTTTKEESSDKFCAENPTSPMCKEAKDPCEDNPDRTGCIDMGTPEEGAALENKAIGLSSITVVGLASNASCPADLPLPKGMSFSFQPFCDFASALRPIIVAMAWLSSAFLLFGMN